MRRSRPSLRLRPLPMALSDVVRTTPFRLTAVLGAMLVVAVAAVLGLTFVLTERELVARSDRVLIRQAAYLAAARPEQMEHHLQDMLNHSASGLNFYALLDGDDHLIRGNIVWRGKVPQMGRPFTVAAGQVNALPLRALMVPLPDGRRLMVARDITPITDMRARMLAIFLWSGGAVICLATVAAVALSLGPLRRIRQIHAIAQRIAGGDLGQRMPLSGRRDELDTVAATVNTMMGEIERLMLQVKGTSDAIAHDLRTPLGHLRLRLGELQRQGNSDAVLGEAIEELDAVLARFSALLRISELDAAGRRACFALFDPMAMLATAAELYEPLAEERGITLALRGAFGHTIEGDEALLLEAIGNLLDNAIKFTPPGGKVALAVAAQADRVVLEVRDNGPGIPPAERADVLRRFHRGAQAHHTPGSGLGLSLVAGIAHLHGFALELRDAEPGLLVRLVAPARG